MTSPDIIVVGLGAVGSAALYQLTKRGVKVLGIDRYAPPHSFGSSHGESRITRQSTDEGAHYVPFVMRSHDIWRDLEAETGTPILQASGILMIAERGSVEPDNYVESTARNAVTYGIPHEMLNAAEMTDRFPQFRLVGDETGYYEPGGGLVFPERAIETQLTLARQAGAHTITDETVLSIQQTGTLVKVSTDRATYEAASVIVAAGAWIPKLCPLPFAPLLEVRRQVLHWYEMEDPSAYTKEQFPVFIWQHGPTPEEFLYGFPTIPGTTGLKLATEQFNTRVDPDLVDRTISDAENAAMYRDHIEGRLAGVRPNCLRASACFYTVTPDAGFILDRHPEQDHVVVVSACSGHGFKHAPAIGEAAAELASQGKSRLDASGFALARFS